MVAECVLCTRVRERRVFVRPAQAAQTAPIADLAAQPIRPTQPSPSQAALDWADLRFESTFGATMGPYS